MLDACWMCKWTSLALSSGRLALLRMLQKRGDLPLLRVLHAACSDCALILIEIAATRCASGEVHSVTCVQSTGGPGAIKAVQVKGPEGAWQGMTNKCAPDRSHKRQPRNWASMRSCLPQAPTQQLGVNALLLACIREVLRPCRPTLETCEVSVPACCACALWHCAGSLLALHDSCQPQVAWERGHRSHMHFNGFQMHGAWLQLHDRCCCAPDQPC